MDKICSHPVLLFDCLQGYKYLSLNFHHWLAKFTLPLEREVKYKEQFF